MRDERRKVEGIKQGYTNSKAKQHNTPKAVTLYIHVHVHKPNEIRSGNVGLKEEPLVGCHGVLVCHLPPQAHAYGRARGNQSDHVTGGCKTR